MANSFSGSLLRQLETPCVNVVPTLSIVLAMVPDKVSQLMRLGVWITIMRDCWDFNYLGRDNMIRIIKTHPDRR